MDTDSETKMNIYRQSLMELRSETRELWGKVILLSSVILGFSVTMYSTDYSTAVNLCWLKTGWIAFLINMLCGLFLLKKDSDFVQSQKLADLAYEWDMSEITIPVETQNDKDKFLALVYLHGLRSTPEKENPYSQYAQDIVERVKTELTSWKLIKNPEKFYSYSHRNMINIGSNIFYVSLVAGIGFLILAVLF